MLPWVAIIEMITLKYCSGCYYVILRFLKSNVAMKKSTLFYKVPSVSLIFQKFLKLNPNHTCVCVLTQWDNNLYLLVILLVIGQVWAIFERAAPLTYCSYWQLLHVYP